MVVRNIKKVQIKTIRKNINNKINNRKLKIILICLVFIFCFISILPVVSSINVYPIRIKNSTIPSSDVEFIYIKADNHFEYGKEVAKRYEAVIRFRFPTFFRIKLVLAGMSQSEKNEISNHLDICDPDFKSEIQGFRTVLDKMYPLTSIDDIETVYIIRKSISLDFNFKGECTTTLATNNATSNGKYNTFLTQNIDSSFLWKSLWEDFSYSPKIIKIGSKNAYAAWGIPLIGELVFLNEKQLGMGGNGLSLNDNPPSNTDGDSTNWLDRKTMMECDDVSSVDELWGNSDRSFWTNEDWPHFYDNSIRAWCDKDGGILMIEQTHDYYNAVYTNPDNPEEFPDVLWHSNHHLWNDDDYGSIEPGEGHTSYERAKRAYELLTTEDNNYGNINFNTCQDIINDIENGNPLIMENVDICRWSRLKDRLTEMAWITMPETFEVY